MHKWNGLVAEELLGEVPIRQYVVTIPKMLRLGFKYDRKLLGELSRCFYETIKEIFLAAAPQAESSLAGSPVLPAMISSVQTYEERLSHQEHEEHELGGGKGACPTSPQTLFVFFVLFVAAFCVQCLNCSEGPRFLDSVRRG